MKRFIRKGNCRKEYAEGKNIVERFLGNGNYGKAIAEILTCRKIENVEGYLWKINFICCLIETCNPQYAFVEGSLWNDNYAMIVEEGSLQEEH